MSYVFTCPHRPSGSLELELQALVSCTDMSSEKQILLFNRTERGSELLYHLQPFNFLLYIPLPPNFWYPFVKTKHHIHTHTNSEVLRILTHLLLSMSYFGIHIMYFNTLRKGMFKCQQSHTSGLNHSTLKMLVSAPNMGRVKCRDVFIYYS